MIKLEVEDYCHSCGYFEAEVTGPVTLYRMGEDDVVFGDTIIRCSYRDRCKNINKFLSNRMQRLKGDTHE